MSIRDDHGLLTEKYRPLSLENFVGNSHIKKTISQYLSQNDIQNYIFFGPSGTGKTTLAKLIAKNLNCDYIYINSSEERGIDTIREKVKGFASVASFKPLKVIILDEADFLTIQSQASLRNIIETFSRTTRFILTCNYLERIIDPLQSRCQVLKIIPPSKKEIAQHLVKILDTEEIKYEVKDLALIINKYYPDLRRCLNTIQSSIHDNKLIVEKELLVHSYYIEEIIDELKTPKPNFRKIRQIIANSSQNSFEELFRELYIRTEEYAPNLEGSVILTINEYQYQAQFAVDKEINICACIYSIIKLKQ